MPVIGTEDNDVLYGTEFGDIISGLGGDDEIYGFGGDDTLEGGDGVDMLFGGDGNDLLDGGGFVEGSLEYLDGGAGNDTLITGGGFVYGGSGDDFLDGEFLYEPAGGGVIINLSDVDQVVDGQVVGARTAIDEFGDTDTFAASVQFGHASSFDDVVFGSEVGAFIFLEAGHDFVEAGGGNDFIDGGPGNDIIDGGNGFDIVDYSDGDEGLEGFVPITMGVVVDLQNGTATDGWGDTDTLIKIEHVDGTYLGDTISGDRHDNWLDGAGGNDSIHAGAGNDHILGGTGDDTLAGGAGSDTFVFADGDGSDVIEDFGFFRGPAILPPNGLSGDVIDLSGHSAASSFTDVEANAEQVNADVVIGLGDDTLILQNFSLANLDAGDFLF